MVDPPYKPSLITAVLALADAPARGADTTDLLGELSGYCLRLPGVEAGSVLMADEDGRLTERAASDPVADRIERLQLDAAEGPCRDSYGSGKRLPDLPLPHPHCRARWPRFTHRALTEGFTGATALPLRHHGRMLGAVNLFHQHRALPPPGIRAGQALADATALALTYQRALDEHRLHKEQLEGALASRVLIEQAKGVLAERLHLTPDESFELLRRHARTHRGKLSDLAHEVITTPAEQGPFPRPSHR